MDATHGSREHHEGERRDDSDGLAFVPGPIGPDGLRQIDAYWRAANYLSVGQIYLMANPLLREPLKPEHVKPRLLGHWGTTPGLNFIYAHLKVRVVNVVDLMTLPARETHSHGLDDPTFDSLFTRDRPVVFAYHGYPAHSPADLQVHEPRQLPRARLHRGGHDDHAFRPVRAEPPRPLPHGSGRPAGRTGAGSPGRARRGGAPRCAGRSPRARLPTGDDLPEVKDWAWPDRHGHEYPGRRRIEADFMQCDTAGAEELRPARAADDRARNA